MISVVGIGPGLYEHMTMEAVESLKKAEVVVGYKTYMDLIKPLIEEKDVVVNGMRGEKARCQKAIDLALEGKRVAVVSSGDPGVYAMAGLVMELLSESDVTLPVEIIPGVTSANAAAAVLGAPIMHDHVYISLSDLLTDWLLIQKRLDLAAQGDFVICLFNPKSMGRPDHIGVAREILLRHKSPDTIVGIVKNAKRAGQVKTLTTLDKMLEHTIDMTTMVIIGNSKTYVRADMMITPRGYLL